MILIESNLFVKREKPKSAHFFKLYTNVQGRLYAYLITVVHNRDIAEDLFQETAALMWEKFDLYQENTNFGAWGIAIARNLAFAHLRKSRKQNRLFEDSFYHDISELADKASDGLLQYVDTLDHCLKKLPPDDQKLLSLRFTRKLSIQDISWTLGCSASSIYKHMTSILRLLHVCIKRTVGVED